MSTTNPEKTIIAPTHCWAVSTFPKMNTENRTEKNFLKISLTSMPSKLEKYLHVVIMDTVKGPKFLIVRKMKYWPATEQRQKARMRGRICGCLGMNALPPKKSPLKKQNGIRIRKEQKFVQSIMSFSFGENLERTWIVIRSNIAQDTGNIRRGEIYSIPFPAFHHRDHHR